MKYFAVTGFCAPGGVDLNPGDSIELTERDAALYVAQGRLKAVPADEPRVTTRRSGGNKEE